MALPALRNLSLQEGSRNAALGADWRNEATVVDAVTMYLDALIDMELGWDADFQSIGTASKKVSWPQEGDVSEVRTYVPEPYVEDVSPRGLQRGVEDTSTRAWLLRKAACGLVKDMQERMPAVSQQLQDLSAYLECGRDNETYIAPSDLLNKLSELYQLRKTAKALEKAVAQSQRELTAAAAIERFLPEKLTDDFYRWKLRVLAANENAVDGDLEGYAFEQSEADKHLSTFWTEEQSSQLSTTYVQSGESISQRIANRLRVNALNLPRRMETRERARVIEEEANAAREAAETKAYNATFLMPEWARKSYDAWKRLNGTDKTKLEAAKAAFVQKLTVDERRRFERDFGKSDKAPDKFIRDATSPKQRRRILQDR